MSDAKVTREGLENVRPGREAHVAAGGGHGRRREPVKRPRDSYYGQPIINPPTWAELDIAGYLFTGGLAGASSLLAAGADLTARPQLARRSRVMALGAIGVSLVALVHDLGRPERFLHMLRVVKLTSPMSVGVWILTVYAPLAGAAAASDVSGRLPRLGRACGLGAAFMGAGVASYTAALISDTAVPAWHEGHREMPFLFVGSAASAAAGWGMLAAPAAQNRPARRMGVAGAAVELLSERLLARRLGPVAETLETGQAGTRLKAAKLLTAGGLALAASPLGRRRPAAAVAGAALLAGSALTRFGVFAAGMRSAEDPKYTVAVQRSRLGAADRSA